MGVLHILGGLGFLKGESYSDYHGLKPECCYVRNSSVDAVPP